MKFKSVIDSPCGLRYMFDDLELQSGAARKVVLESEMMTVADDIEVAYVKLKEFHAVFVSGQGKHEILQTRLARLKDINGTIGRLGSGAVLDDVELFEIKQLAILSGEVGKILQAENIGCVALPDLTEALGILDPEGMKVPSFYIYDSYSSELKSLREEIKKNPRNSDELVARSFEMEDKIRAELSAALRHYADDMAAALDVLCEIDILLAKALQMKRYGFVFPTFSADGKTRYEGLFHPQVRDILQGQNKEFQPVDIWFDVVPTTIIGANMGGKTVALKMTALSQLLFQFGFGIPASGAEIDVKEKVSLHIGEEESLEKGLSSFAAEMLRIDGMIGDVKSGARCLILIDEPARTTNPVEGTALVSALVGVMRDRNSDVIVTTHYDLKDTDSRRLRVKGLTDGAMDYRLVETSDSEVPHEALAIAEKLGVDEEWIEAARDILKR